MSSSVRFGDQPSKFRAVVLSATRHGASPSRRVTTLMGNGRLVVRRIVSNKFGNRRARAGAQVQRRCLSARQKVVERPDMSVRQV